MKILFATFLFGVGVLPAQNARVDALYEKFVKGPGCVVGVVQNGKVVHAKGYGLADLEHDVPLSPQSVFYLASVSKQFTAMSVLMLASEGKIALEDSIRKTIPELPAYADPITIRQLLHHTSGLRDYLTLGDLAGYSPDHVFTDHSALRLITRQKALNFAPGTDFLYSNSGYVLLSMIVKRASGKLLDDYAREHIFTPLGMSSTRFQHDHTNPIPNRALGYERRDGTWHIANSMLDVAGDGGLYSSVEDLMKWAANFDEPKVGGAALIEMRKRGRLQNGHEIDYGMGLAPGQYAGLPIFQHGGGLAGYRTMIAHFPSERLAVVTLCNNGGNSPSFKQVAAAFLPSLPASDSPKEPPPPKPEGDDPVPTQERKAWIGNWWSEELNVSCRIYEQKGQLLMEVADNPAETLQRAAAGKVRLSGDVMTMEAGGRSFTLDAGRVRGIRYTRR